MTVVSLGRFLRDRSGASAVEFALVATPFLLLVFGIVEFGRYQWTRMAIHETAIAGARCMGVKHASCAPGGTYSSAQTVSFIQTQATGWSVSIPSASITLSNSVSCSGTAGFSRVAIAHTFQTAVPVLLGSLANGVPINAAACFPNQT